MYIITTCALKILAPSDSKTRLLIDVSSFAGHHMLYAKVSCANFAIYFWFTRTDHLKSEFSLIYSP